MVHLVINWFSGVYTIISRYMSLAQAVRVGQAGILAIALLFICRGGLASVRGRVDYLIPRSVVVGGRRRDDHRS